MDWHHRMRGWISKPPTKTLLVLVVLSILSFSPALISNSQDLQISQTVGGLVFNDLPVNVDGVGSSHATCRDDPNCLHPPDSDSRPFFFFFLNSNFYPGGHPFGQAG